VRAASNILALAEKSMRRSARLFYLVNINELLRKFALQIKSIIV